MLKVSRLKNGRFTKKSRHNRYLKGLGSIAIKQIEENASDRNPELELLEPGTTHIVELNCLARNLVCCHCKTKLYLSNLIEESKKGPQSILNIKCEACNKSTKVNTEQKNESGSSTVNI